MDEKMTVVLATTNAGKVRELAGPLGELGVNLVGLDAFPEVGEIVEDGHTFSENAYIKASTVARKTGLASIADDSGLQVAALSGRPGVYSARYGDDWDHREGESRDMRNMRKLLAEMAAVPAARRQARFVCCMVAVMPGHVSPDEALVVEGRWNGFILEAPVGANGFGYDPVFRDPELTVSAAQLTREEKGARSHRGRAVRALVAGWGNWVAAMRSLPAE